MTIVILTETSSERETLNYTVFGGLVKKINQVSDKYSE